MWTGVSWMNGWISVSIAIGFGRDAKTGKRGITMVGENVNVPQQTVNSGCRSKILPGLSLSDLNTHLVAP